MERSKGRKSDERHEESGGREREREVSKKKRWMAKREAEPIKTTESA